PDLALADRVADREKPGVDDTNHVARVRLLDDLALLTEQPEGSSQTDLPSQTRMPNLHVPPECAGADAQKRDAVAVTWVHVRLDLEDETGKRRGIRFDERQIRTSGRGRRRVIDEGIEKELDAEVGQRAAERHRRQLAGQDAFEIERGAGQLHQ